MLKKKPRSDSKKSSKKAAATPPRKSESKKTVAAPEKKTGRELATPSMFEKDARAGQEGMGREDYAIPRLTILQDLSPQVKKTETAYIDGAEPGDICDTVSGTLYSGEDGVVVIPVSYRRAHLEWVPRTKGGGFVADHGSDGKIIDKCQRDEKGGLTLENGNIIKITAEYFVLMVDEATGESVAFVLSMTGSQMKKARRWNTMMNQLRVPKDGCGTFNPAMFYRGYKLTTAPERNDQGSWFGWAIAPDKNTIEYPEGEQLYIAAREFRASVASGAVKASAPAPAEHAEPEESEASPM